MATLALMFRFSWPVTLAVLVTILLVALAARGRLVGQGTHAELLARGGLYADLYDRQFRTQPEIPQPGQTPLQPASVSPCPAPAQWAEVTLPGSGVLRLAVRTAKLTPYAE